MASSETCVVFTEKTVHRRSYLTCLILVFLTMLRTQVLIFVQVVEELSNSTNGLYNMDNVMISATHTHSGVGGYLMHTLFDLPSYGFSLQSFNAMVSGIVKVCP